jgi:hypothetical protein
MSTKISRKKRTTRRADTRTLVRKVQVRFEVNIEHIGDDVEEYYERLYEELQGFAEESEVGLVFCHAVVGDKDLLTQRED